MHVIADALRNLEPEAPNTSNHGHLGGFDIAAKRTKLKPKILLILALLIGSVGATTLTLYLGYVSTDKGIVEARTTVEVEPEKVVLTDEDFPETIPNNQNLPAQLVSEKKRANLKPEVTYELAWAQRLTNTKTSARLKESVQITSPQSSPEGSDASPSFVPTAIESKKPLAGSKEPRKIAAKRTVQRPVSEHQPQTLVKPANSSVLFQAKLFEQQGEISKAIGLLESNSYDDEHWRIQRWQELGRLNYTLGQYIQSMRWYRNVLNVDRADTKSLLGMAVSLEAMGEEQKASAYYQAVIRKLSKAHPASRFAQQRLVKLAS